MQHGGRVACGEGLDPDRYRVSHEATLVLLMGVALCGCSRSHAAGEADAGGPSWDLGPFIVDEGPVVLPAVCLDEPCAIEGESCNERVCWEARYAGIYSTYVEAPQCSFAANSAAASVTWNGEPCGVAEHGADGEQRGPAVPVELCVALRDPESTEGQPYGALFPTGCIWSDGLPVTAVAPETPCTGFEPAVITGGVEVFLRGFCGGTCGTAGCPALDGSSFCVGRSDERSFGACARTSLRCRASEFHLDESCLGAPLAGYGEPCICMVTYPQHPDELELVGWQVPQSVCERYRDTFPASVECRDASFRLIE
jgi:hypothetical protein